MQNKIKGSARKAGAKPTAANKGVLVQGGGTALLPNCQGFVGKAYVSIHSRRCPLLRYRSVGHRPFVHGTSAQYKLATSTWPNVVRNKPAKTKEAAAKPKPRIAINANIIYLS